MRSLKALAATLGTAAALLLTTLSSPTPAAADTVPVTTTQALRFVSYNMCGNVCADGKGPTGYSNAARIDSIVAEANSTGWKADQIFLQEVCQDQYTELSTKLAPLGFNGRFTAALTGRGDACAGDPYGNALFVKGAIVQTKMLDLTQGSTETEPIRVPCVKSDLRGRLNWACSVHLFWGHPDGTNPERDAEAADLRWQVEAWERSGIPVILGGDFNGFPSDTFMDGFYSPAAGGNSHGVFTEADQSDKGTNPNDIENSTLECPAKDPLCRSGEPTFYSLGKVNEPNDEYWCKIDYLFFSTRHFKDVVGDSLPVDTEVSDHRLLRGAANWAS